MNKKDSGLILADIDELLKAGPVKVMAESDMTNDAGMPMPVVNRFLLSKEGGAYVLRERDDVPKDVKEKMKVNYGRPYTREQMLTSLEACKKITTEKRIYTSARATGYDDTKPMTITESPQP